MSNKRNYIRIISRLDIKGPNLVKGIHLEGLRVLGRPAEFAQYYYEQGADELLFMDVVASLYERNALNEIIKETAQNIFIPITVGGGIRTLEDINKLLRSGADKVSINTAAIRRPLFIKEAAIEFGNSTIVGTIEAIKQPSGQYLAFVDNAREHTGLEIIDWAKKLEDLGIGELMITSVDRDGTGLGFDIELVNEITKAVNIPVIAHGGAGNVQHIEDLVAATTPSAIAVASLIHYDAIKNIKNDERSGIEGNREFVRQQRPYGRISPCGIFEIKELLNKKGMDTRRVTGGFVTNA